MASAAGFDVCDLNAIYDTAGYSYSLPRTVLEGFLRGKAFDHPEEYTPDELARLKEDINDLYQKMMTNPPSGNLAVISAGSPGVGKTTLLNQLLRDASLKGLQYPYVCPDDVCLKGQTRTYVADITAGEGTFAARETAYTKWRPGSNAATHILLAHLIKERVPFYFGTTCSSPLTGRFFGFLNERGYRIKVIHVSAPDDVRLGSIQARDATFVQTTEADVREKGLLVPQRIQDTFLRYADEIKFYYRSGVAEDAVLAATWLKGPTESAGTLTVIDPDAYKGVKAVHNMAIETLKKPELQWETAVEAASTMQ